MRHPSKWQGGAECEGRYANYFEIGYNAFEFVLDFGQSYVGQENGAIHSRIVVGPAYAKAFSRLLRETVDQYEAAHGMIENQAED